MKSGEYRTPIVDSEWHIPPQAGRVRRLADGFEFRMGRLGVLR